MNIIERLQEWQENQERKRRNKYCKRLRLLVAEIRAEKNRGRLSRLVLELPSVSRVDTESGGFRMAYCTAYLRDGYSFVGRDLFIRDAIRNCAAKVIWYLRKQK